MDIKSETSSRYENTERFHKWLVSAWQHEMDWRKNNQTYYEFRDGDHWSDAERAVILERQQQPVTVNMVAPMINMAIAVEVNRRTNLQVVGREEKDQSLAHILTRLLKQTLQESEYHYFKTQVYRQGLTGGVGWFEIWPDEDTEAKEPQIRVSMRRWEDVFSDPFSVRPDRVDARFLIRRIWTDVDWVEEKYDKEKADSINAHRDLLHDGYAGQEIDAQMSEDQLYFDVSQPSARRVAIYQCWYRDSKNKIRQVVWSGDTFLEGSEKDEDNKYPYRTANVYPLVPFLCDTDHKNLPLGIVAQLKSPQETLNKTLNKYLYLISSKQLLYEEGALVRPEEIREEVAKANSIIEVKAGMMHAVQIKENLNEPAQLLAIAQQQIMLMQRISGINDTMQGFASPNERTAQQQVNRLAQGSMTQTSYIENEYFTSRQVARVVLRLIGAFYTKRKVIRITENDDIVNTIAINDPELEADEFGNPVMVRGKPKETGKILNKIEDILRYDVIFQEVAPFTSAREQQALILSELTKSGMFPAEIAADLIVNLMDIGPDKQEVIRRIQQVFQQNGGQANPPAPEDAAIGSPPQSIR